MGTWQNADGLWIRLGPDEADNAIGGQYGDAMGVHEVEFDLAFNDFNSTTPAVPRTTDSFGIAIPAGARVEEIEFFVRTVFTVSAGTVAAGTLQLGFVRNDRTTALNTAGLTTSALTGTVLNLGTAGSKTVIRVGSTGAATPGTNTIGVALSEQGLICAANTTHGTNTYNAGVLRVRLRYSIP